MNNIMTDLETMSTRVDAAIIAIGAVRFDHAVTDRFYMTVDLQSCLDAGLAVDGKTIMWWLQQDEAARAEFSGDGLHLGSCLCSFSNWIGDDALIWGNGAAFDNAVLANAYRAMGLKQPWEFFNDRCYRTMKNLHRDIVMGDRVGTKHLAVDDAENQALHLMKIWNAHGRM